MSGGRPKYNVLPLVWWWVAPGPPRRPRSNRVTAPLLLGDARSTSSRICRCHEWFGPGFGGFGLGRGGAGRAAPRPPSTDRRGASAARPERRRRSTTIRETGRTPGVVRIAGQRTTVALPARDDRPPVLRVRVVLHEPAELHPARRPPTPVLTPACACASTVPPPPATLGPSRARQGTAVRARPATSVRNRSATGPPPEPAPAPAPSAPAPGSTSGPAAGGLQHRRPPPRTGASDAENGAASPPAAPPPPPPATPLAHRHLPQHRHTVPLPHAQLHSLLSRIAFGLRPNMIRKRAFLLWHDTAGFLTTCRDCSSFLPS